MPIVLAAGDELQFPPIPKEGGLLAPIEGTSEEQQVAARIFSNFTYVYRLTTAMRFHDDVLIEILRKMRVDRSIIYKYVYINIYISFTSLCRYQFVNINMSIAYVYISMSISICVKIIMSISICRYQYVNIFMSLSLCRYMYGMDLVYHLLLLQGKGHAATDVVLD